MRKRFDHNLRFLTGGVLLFFAIILLVAIFTGLSLKLYWDRRGEAAALSHYAVALAGGFGGEACCLMLNDSVLFDGVVPGDTLWVEANRLAVQNVLFVVDGATGDATAINLPQRATVYVTRCGDGGGVRWSFAER